MIKKMMFVPMVALLLACSPVATSVEPTTQVVYVSTMTNEQMAEHTGDPFNETTEESEKVAEVSSEIRAATYGDTSIEEKVFRSDAIVRATMTSLSSEVVVDDDGQHLVVLKFDLAVSEYMKGNGPSRIVAVWVDGSEYDTREHADTAKANVLARRDDQWDEREAVIFLYGKLSVFGASLNAQLQRTDHSLIYVGDPYSYDDYYSLHSREHKRWLPAVSGTGSAGDDQKFLLDVPSATGTPPTITLGQLKSRIAEVTAELAGGDGSEAYQECVKAKHEFERQDRYFQELDGTNLYDKSPQDSVLASGQPADTIMHERNWFGIYPDTKARTWIEGRDAALFSVVQGEATPNDSNRDGVLTAGVDEIRYMENFLVERPLPGGEYEIDRKEVWRGFLVCNFVLSNEWTVTVEAPEGTLHEAFFDPVTDGTAVAADDTNGVLKPATFTDANGASSTIERVAWEPGTGSESGKVEIELSSDDAIADHVVELIELDGTVSLSLNADEATLDTANDALSWSVASQPWEDGDELMVRIREVRGTCSDGTAVPNPSANPRLVSDCKALLTIKGKLRGTAPLNWSPERSITTWDGVTVKGTPSRVTEIKLTDKSLDGTIPTKLAELTGLQVLHLYENKFTGTIPSELGSLTALTDLRLYDNRLTGTIPSELGSLTALTDLRLYDNQLSGGIPSELGGLSNLVILYLDGNQLTGAIPTELGNLSNLVALHLDGNQLTGTIPTELGNLSNLRDLFLGRNQLTGGIPTQLGNLSSLSFLNLDGNQLTGAIPTQLGSLTNMQDLSLSNNRLTGGIPTQLGDLTKLRDLFLNGNQFTGSIPTQLGKLADLQVLDLRSNRLTGSIPSELGKLSKLETLYLHNNQMTGAIPAQLGNLTNLATLWLSGNTLTGCIPAALRNIDNHDLARLQIQYCATP